jgi:hypothetical protein
MFHFVDRTVLLCNVSLCCSILFLLWSCTNGGKEDLLQYRDGRQLLSLNALTRSGLVMRIPDVGMQSQDSVAVGEEFVARLFLKDPAFRIMEAYVGCAEVANPTVDTVLNSVRPCNRLDGCTRSLMILSDTIFIAFRPSTPGEKRFHEITLLTIDQEKIFRTQKYSFQYNVFTNE